MKKRYVFRKCLTSILGVLAALMMSVPSVVFAAEVETETTTGKPASDSTDVKILDSMPIIYTDSNLNATLAVLDMSTGSSLDLNNTTVVSGTVLTYVISYRNTNETTETVHMQIPVPDVYPLRTSYQGRYEGTLVNWDGIEVAPGETVTRYITCDTPKATSMIPNTGLVMISDGQNMQTNTVNVAVSAPAVVTTVEPTPQQPLNDTGVLGAMRRALTAAEDSPAVLGMRRAIQTGDVPYIAVRVALLVAICTAVASVIVLIAKRSKKEVSSHEKN